MKWLARLLGVLIALAVLLALAGLFGPNLMRQRVAEAAERALHRPVVIGNLRLLPSWPPAVQASGVSVTGLGGAPLIQATLAASPLLAGRAVVDEIRLLRPTIVIAPDAQGRVSLIPPSAAPVPASPPATPVPVATRGPAPPPPRIVIHDGTLILRDKRIGPDIHLAVSGADDGPAYDLTLSGVVPPGTSVPALTGAAIAAHVASGKPVHATLAGVWRGQAVQAVVDSGSPEAIAAGGALPLTLAVTAAGATLHGAGSIGDVAARSGIAMTVALRADDERSLATLLGWPRAGSGPVSLDAQISGGSSDYALHGLSLRAPQGDLAGDVALSLGARPSLRGALRSQRLDLDAILAALATPPAAPPASAAPGPAPPPARWLIPDRPLPTAGLARADADLTVSATVLRFAGVDYRDLAGHLLLQGGKLVVDPFAAVLPGGAKLTAALHLDGAGAALTLHAPAISLAPTLAALRLPAIASGNAALDADLHGAGGTLHALAASLDGAATLRLTAGAIDGAVFNLLLGAARLPVKLSAGQTRVSCAALGGVARGGVIVVSPLVADAGKVRIEGAGSVDLGQETLALQLQPLLRTGIGLVIPVRVSGPWRTPKVAVGAGSPLPPSAACPQPASAPLNLGEPGKKHPKPIDVLRSLLR